jgi:molybdate transport system permease protein
VNVPSISSSAPSRESSERKVTPFNGGSDGMDGNRGVPEPSPQLSLASQSIVNNPVFAVEERIVRLRALRAPFVEPAAETCNAPAPPSFAIGSPEPGSALPLVLPPTVIGFYLLIGLGPKSPVGRWIEALLGHPLPFSFAGLVVASACYSLPFAVQPFTAAFRSVSRELIEAAWSVGATRRRAFFRIAIPLAWPGLLSGIVLSFAHTLGEFGVVLMVGGNIPGATRTVSVSIYDAVQSLDYAGASRTAAVLLLISFVVLSVTYTLQRDFRFSPVRSN